MKESIIEIGPNYTEVEQRCSVRCAGEPCPNKPTVRIDSIIEDNRGPVPIYLCELCYQNVLNGTYGVILQAKATNTRKLLK